VRRYPPAPACNGNRRGLIPWLARAVTAALFWSAGTALPQGNPYYNITKIEAKQLSNAVILTIKADGAMTDIHTHDWMVLSNGSPRPIKEIELHCGQGKSQVGDLVDISMYPISHVELLPRTYSNEGIGVNLLVKLYTEARVRHFHTERFSGDWNWTPSMGCCFDGELGRDKQTFVLTVTSDRFAEPALAAEVPASQQLALEPGPNGRYSLYALDLDLKRLTDELGRRTGARIVVDESVTRYVTVNLPEMTVPELLQGLAEGYGLALEVQNGQYVLSKGLPANVATYDTNVTQVVPLDHLSPEAALDLLPNFLLAYVRPSEAQNALIVAGPAQLARRVREDVAKIDNPPQQLRIEVAAVKVSSSRAWHDAFVGEGAIGRDVVSFDPRAGEMGFERLEQPTDMIRATLRKLEQRHLVDTLARAHVTLVNGKWASLFLGEKRYIQVTHNTEYGGEDVAVPVNLGVDVDLGAWTGGDKVALWLHPVVTTLGGVDPASNLPVIDRYETTGALIVPDGHTLLLGGVRLNSDTSMVRSLAGLGAGSGLVPTDRTKALEDAEIALFITARILGEFDDSGESPIGARLARELREAGIEFEVRPIERPSDQSAEE
jgi:hypothetical protein